jgi:uncharacterized protein (DUF1697 family)
MGVNIALIRGVNVGGKNIVKMAELKAAFVKAGFIDALTYINSGNVLFKSDLATASLQTTIQGLLLAEFSIDTPVMVITATELAEALAAAPDWWGEEPETRHNTFFVSPPATVESVCLEVGDIKPEYEKLASHGQVIFWSAAMKTFSRTRWGSISKYPVYLQTTIRNSNTARKLAELATGMMEG